MEGAVMSSACRRMQSCMVVRSCASAAWPSWVMRCRWRCSRWHTDVLATLCAAATCSQNIQAVQMAT